MGIPAVDPPIDHQEAKEVLTLAYEGVFPGQEVNLFALGIAQAIGLMEGNYGRWAAKNNWGAITRTPNPDGSCPSDSVMHGDSSHATGEYQTCFRVYPTSLEGAEHFLKILYIDRPKVFEAALIGDIRGVAQAMYASNYYLGTEPADKKDANGDFSNVNNYIDFIGKGVDSIAFLYPTGGNASGSGGISPVAIAGIGAAALAALIMVKR